jgi:ligand-binding sensor domain-containing protein/signal transduction histidine kinase
LAAVAWAMQLCALAQDFQVRNWQIENGLPDSSVTALAQTPDGYLWVGTRKGLVRFDGDSFKRVLTANGSTVDDPRILGLLTDQQGNLWIASQSGLITQFSEGEFHTRYLPQVLAQPEGAPGVPPLNVRAWQNFNLIFALDGAGTVWARTITGEVMRFAGSGGPTAVPPGNLPEGEVRGLLNDGAGRVWLLKGTNACIFEDGQWRFSTEDKVPPSGEMLCASGYVGFWTAEVSSSEAFAKRLQYESGAGWNSLSLPIPTTPVHASVSAMLQDREGRLWLGVTWAGVYVKQQGAEWRHVQTSGLLAKCTAVCLFEDGQGSIWAGTLGEGLIQVLEPSVHMELLPPDAADVHATTVCAAQDGGLWMGTDKGLYRRPPGESTRVGAIKELSGESVYAVLEDTRSNLWVGTLSGIYRREGSGFKKMLTLPVWLGGIVALYEDRGGDIWAGGPHSSLLRLRHGTGEAAFEAIAVPPSPNLYICSLAEDAQGQIWVAAMMNGLCRVEGKQLVRAGPQFDALGPNTHPLLCDRDGALWIGTFGNGLFRWHDQMLMHYTTDDGLPDDVILGLMEDEQGNLWMTSHNGIFGCSRRQLAEYKRGQSPRLLCRHLGLDEGLANRECTGPGQPVIARGPDGRFWAATMVGAAGFAPGVLAHTASAAEVRLEALNVDGHVLLPGPKGFSVPASSRHFEFQYSAPELAFPKALRLRYRLDGLDQNWVEAGSGRLASYSRLLPGDYQFRVMAGGEDGVWREAKTPVNLRVVPEFWQTIWFRTLAVATIVIALVGGVVAYERRKARRRLEQLEARQAVEQVRQGIARDLHDELGSAITEIIQLGDLTLQPEPEPEMLQYSVKSMTAHLRQLGITLDEIVWTMSSRNDTLPNLAGYISNHAQEFFRHSGIRCRLDVTKNLPKLMVNSQTRHNLFLAVKEALNNVAKHSGAREVVVRVHYAEAVLQVSIEDDGRGFDAAADHPGHGLSNMRERLQAVQGGAEFLRQPEGGARVVFSLSLSVNPQHEMENNPH